MHDDDAVVLVTVTGEPDYGAVIAIRHAAYLAVGKLATDAPAAALADEYDATAIVMLALVRGVPAGTVRICTSPERSAFDYGAHPRFDEAFPRETLRTSVTASRLAVLPSFWGTPVFDALHAQLPLTALRAGRTAVLGSASGRLVDRYVTLGWQRTGICYENRVLRGIVHEYIRLPV